ncbi:MAG: exonuclease domain-containing protein [Chitinophagales bacterium]
MSEVIFTIVDLEFTGGSPRRDKIMEVALVKYANGKIIDRFHSLVNPEKEVSEFLMALVNFSEKRLKKAPVFEDIAEQIFDFTKDTTLVGFNIRLSYALLKSAFKPTPFRFQRPHLDLKMLIEQRFDTAADLEDKPKSKSLGGLCRHFGLKYENSYNLKKRAKTIAQVFEKLFIQHYPSIDKKFVRSIALTAKLPPNLSPQKVDELPKATGVYYFLDKKGRIIYLGKSLHIRDRIMSHFNTDLESSKKQNMITATYDLQYRLTGSELIALLLESDEIKRYMPAFNRAQRRKRYKYGVYIEVNELGFKVLEIDSLKLERKEQLFQKFSSKWQAFSFVLRAAVQYQLSLEWCNLMAFEAWIRQSAYTDEDFVEVEDSLEVHNDKIDRLVKLYSYPADNMLIIDKGRNELEKSVVIIEGNQYLGYAYVPLEKIKPLLVEVEVEVENREVLIGENEEEEILPIEMEKVKESDFEEEKEGDFVVEYDADALVYEEEETFIEANEDLTTEEEVEGEIAVKEEPLSEPSISEVIQLENPKPTVSTKNEIYELTTFHKLTVLPHIRKELIPFRENPDVQQIIRGYLRKKRKGVWIYSF